MIRVGSIAAASDGYYYIKHPTKSEAMSCLKMWEEHKRAKQSKEQAYRIIDHYYERHKGVPESEGLKYDSDKPRTHLVLQDFADALLEIAKVGTQGATKYGDSNWLQVENGFERYSSAMLRHYLAEKESSTDDDSGYLHAAHAAWNALARLQLIMNQHKEDNND